MSINLPPLTFSNSIIYIFIISFYGYCFWELFRYSSKFWYKRKKPVFEECEECSQKAGSPTLCDDCLIRRDGLCEHGKVTGKCVDCYNKQR